MATRYKIIGSTDGTVANSTLSMSTGKILGRSTASSGAVEEITVGSGLSLSAGTLTATGDGTGDMVLATAQTNSGVKTFLDATLGLRNVANTFTSFFTNTNTAARSYTLPDKNGTVAMTSDITGTNSGTNTGDQTSIVGISGTIAQFNTALSDGDFATIAGSETLTNKTLTSPSISNPSFSTSVGFGAKTAYFTETDNGNSGTADTIDWGVSNKQKSTLTGNCTFTFTAPPGPCSLILKLVQDATGSRTVTWPAAVHWPAGTAPTLTTTANKVDIITFYYDGSVYYGNYSLNFTA